MRRALELAERGRGYVEPNPLVGAVVMREGKCVGEGWHERFGQAHAEVNALAAAGEQARGATLYVTLEPCCHHGKTPPCTDAILRAGINRVVAAMADPFPLVSGKGAEQLRAAGVTVEIGLGEAEARRLNAPYLHLLGTGRPYVTAKWAMTLDGKIATATGDSKWISSKASRHLVHELRGRMDGIVVGIGTALADDPLLTARPPGPRTPLRIVLDSQARLPPGSQLARTARDVPTLVVIGDCAPGDATSELRKLGCEVLALPTEQGRPRLDALLDELGRRRLTNLLIEGGSGVLGSFHDLKAIQEVYVFIAPRLVGGVAARSPIGGTGSPTLADSLRLAEWHVESIEDDVLVHGWF
jgi:diaminohydroxyphosphoribosylaminopyrimidine deaminase/5-amino-6-(5-phosphoribosylamino)uracil reductase